MRDVNKQLLKELNKWDPLGYGEGAYETEVFDVLQAANELGDVKQLAKRIQFIYEFSFEEVIPLIECQRMAKSIIEIKDNLKCAI